MEKEDDYDVSTVVGDSEYIAIRRYGQTKVIGRRLLHTSMEAELAFQFVERWGMVAAEDGGEDSAGRAKLRSCSPDEIVGRATEIAEKLVAACRQRDWILPVPRYDEFQKQALLRSNEG